MKPKYYWFYYKAPRKSIVREWPIKFAHQRPLVNE